MRRAFSVFVFDADSRLLIQKRSASKYHFRGIWANTCCTHPRPGEAVEVAAHRRLREEMGFDCPLQERFAFTYRAVSHNGLSEYELDHVLTGHFGGKITPDLVEVEDFKWVCSDELMHDIADSPGAVAPWLKIIAARVFEDLGINRTGQP